MRKNCKRQIKKNLEQKKLLKGKEINYMLNGKDMIIRLIVDVSNFALKSNLASLKTEVDKINGHKLKTVPVDLSKLSNLVNNDVVKNSV